jgi:hypothetical protein
MQMTCRYILVSTGQICIDAQCRLSMVNVYPAAMEQFPDAQNASTICCRTMAVILGFSHR